MFWQGAYYLVTGLWPVFSPGTFQKMTGPKTDLWLVKTYGIIVAAVGSGFLIASRDGSEGLEMKTLACLVAAAIAAAETYYALRRVISRVYLCDGVLELAFVAAVLKT